jgi:phosphoglycolate phosphatase
MQKLVLFDVDGTLLNTLGAGRAAMVTAMRAVYGETGPVDDYDFHGKTDPAIVRELLRAAGCTDGRIESGFEQLWRLYYLELEKELAARDGRVFVYAGVRELLEWVSRDQRFVAGLVTGNMEPGAWQKLRACGLEGRFRFGAFGSDSERREDLPPLAADRAAEILGRPFRLEDAVVVGDTPADIHCARANSARVLAVATGRHTLNDLAGHGPDALVADLADTDLIVRFLGDG